VENRDINKHYVEEYVDCVSDYD